MGSRKEPRATRRGRKESDGGGRESVAPCQRGRLCKRRGQVSIRVEKLPQPPPRPVPLSAVARSRPRGWRSLPERRLPGPSGSVGPGGDGRRMATGGGDALPAPCRGPGLAAEAWWGFGLRQDAAPSGCRCCVRIRTAWAVLARTAKPHLAVPAGAFPPGSSRKKTISRPTRLPRAAKILNRHGPWKWAAAGPPVPVRTAKLLSPRKTDVMFQQLLRPQHVLTVTRAAEN